LVSSEYHFSRFSVQPLVEVGVAKEHSGFAGLLPAPLVCTPRLAAEAQSERLRGTAVAHCVHGHDNRANMHRGWRFREMTCDYVSAEAGIYRYAETIPGHRYRIEACGKHIHSEWPMELFSGVDLTAGESWQAGRSRGIPGRSPGRTRGCIPRLPSAPVRRRSLSSSKGAIQ